MKTRQEHIDFIWLNRVAIAACAWNGHQNMGRGLVCVLCDQENGTTRTVPFDFMKTADAEKLLAPWKESKEEKMVSTYDPEMEVVISFVSSSGTGLNFDSYLLRLNPRPPIAADR